MDSDKLNKTLWEVAETLAFIVFAIWGIAASMQDTNDHDLTLWGGMTLLIAFLALIFMTLKRIERAIADSDREDDAA